jgi:hypothetical protein
MKPILWFAGPAPDATKGGSVLKGVGQFPQAGPAGK